MCWRCLRPDQMMMLQACAQHYAYVNLTHRPPPCFDSILDNLLLTLLHACGGHHQSISPAHLRSSTFSKAVECVFVHA